jgi:hypothetical protein
MDNKEIEHDIHMALASIMQQTLDVQDALIVGQLRLAQAVVSKVCDLLDKCETMEEVRALLKDNKP